jgi:hypothetical protein
MGQGENGHRREKEEGIARGMGERMVARVGEEHEAM